MKKITTINGKENPGYNVLKKNYLAFSILFLFFNTPLFSQSSNATAANAASVTAFWNGVCGAANLERGALTNFSNMSSCWAQYKSSGLNFIRWFPLGSPSGVSVNGYKLPSQGQMQQYLDILQGAIDAGIKVEVDFMDICDVTADFQNMNSTCVSHIKMCSNLIKAKGWSPTQVKVGPWNEVAGNTNVALRPYMNQFVAEIRAILPNHVITIAAAYWGALSSTTDGTWVNPTDPGCDVMVHHYPGSVSESQDPNHWSWVSSELDKFSAANGNIFVWLGETGFAGPNDASGQTDYAHFPNALNAMLTYAGKHIPCAWTISAGAWGRLNNSSTDGMLRSEIAAVYKNYPCTVGCTGPTITANTNVNNAGWTQKDTEALCEGGTVAFGPGPATTTGWSWTGPNNYSASVREITLSNVKANQSGTYTATYDDGKGCPSKKNFYLTVNAPPTVTAVLNINNTGWVQKDSAVLCPGGTVAFGPHPWQDPNGWTWTGPNNYTASGREITLNNMQVNQSGIYTATYNNGNGCPSSKKYYVTVSCTSTGINSLSGGNAISIYPNPFSANFNIEISAGVIIKDALINIYDVCGKQVRSISITDHETVIDRAELQSGLYFYSIINGDTKIANGKIVVQD